MIKPSQALQFAGKSVLVTGGSSGIGAAVARSFGAAGARVAVHYAHNREGAESVASIIRQSGGQAITPAGDLLDRSAPDPLVAQTDQAFGGLDILINNAGDMFGRRPLEQASDEDFDRVVGLNTHAAFAICRACAPVMRRAGRGSVINTTLIAARRGIPMGRLGSYDECVGAYLFLADDLLSSYITGQIIEVNGGQLMP